MRFKLFKLKKLIYWLGYRYQILMYYVYRRDRNVERIAKWIEKKLKKKIKMIAQSVIDSGFGDSCGSDIALYFSHHQADFPQSMWLYYALYRDLLRKPWFDRSLFRDRKWCRLFFKDLKRIPKNPTADPWSLIFFALVDLTREMVRGEELKWIHICEG